MRWYRFIGIDTDLLEKVDPKHNERQSFILSVLTLMLFVISIICFLSSVVFCLIVFQNWLIALAVSAFISMVIFNLYRLFVMTGLDVSGSHLEAYYLAHDKHYAEHIDLTADLSAYEEGQILEIVNTAKDKLREKTANTISSTSEKIHPMTMTLRVGILAIIALVFCNGIELFLFKNQINAVIADLVRIYASKNEVWMLNNFFKTDAGTGFSVLNTNSLLLSLDILISGLGYWKLVLDLVFLTIFLLPLVIVFKSKEIKESEYVRELALSELTITFYHYFHTQKLCKKIKDEILSTPIVFSKDTVVRTYEE